MPTLWSKRGVGGPPREEAAAKRLTCRNVPTKKVQDNQLLPTGLRAKRAKSNSRGRKVGNAPEKAATPCPVVESSLASQSSPLILVLSLLLISTSNQPTKYTRFGFDPTQE